MSNETRIDKQEFDRRALQNKGLVRFYLKSVTSLSESEKEDLALHLAGLQTLDPDIHVLEEAVIDELSQTDSYNALGMRLLAELDRLPKGGIQRSFLESIFNKGRRIVRASRNTNSRLRKEISLQ